MSQLLQGVTFFAVILLWAEPASYGQEKHLPDETKLQSGDLIWPKNRGTSVPFAGQPSGALETDRTLWEKERSDFLEKIRRKGNAAPAHERRAADQLAGMSYEDFRARYLGNRQPGTPVPFGAFPLYVGHVGILLVEDGKPFVVEAVPSTVRRIPYQEWLNERSDADVWHGRILYASIDARADVAQQALTQIGKPYAFWNFDLSDDAGFYCSKLVWWSVYNALGIAIDGERDPARSFWLTPKQLMAVERLQMIYEPAPYR